MGRGERPLDINDNCELRRILCVNAYALYLRCIDGTPMSKNMETIHWMITNPRVGDLVMEISTIHNHTCDKVRLGYLTKVDEDMRNHRGKCYHIRLPGQRHRLFRWENAFFIRVLERIPSV